VFANYRRISYIYLIKPFAMKKACIVTIVILNLIFAINRGHCQSTIKIEIADLMIIRSNKPTQISLGSSKNKVIEAFGQPVTVRKSYFVKFDFRGEMIDYKGAQFYFVNNRLEAFDLKSNQFSIQIKGTHNYAVVGNISNGFVKAVPKAQFTTITLQHNDVYYDEVLGFTFDARNKILNITCGPD